MRQFDIFNSHLGQRVVASIALFCGCLVFSGCGGGGKVPVAAEQASVSGSAIGVDGKTPIGVDSVVTFESSAKSSQATGKVDALGKYTLTASDKGVGIPAGRYKVTITPPHSPTQSTSSDDYKKMMSAPVVTKPVESTSDIPVKFQSMVSSSIDVELKPGPNTIDLDLSKIK